MSAILFFDSPAALDIRRSGGKGANLARLTQAGLPVPGGFVVAADAYWAFIEQSAGAARQIANLSSSAGKHLTRRAKALRKTLAGLDLPADLRREIAEAVTTLGKDNAYAVRSSSTLEDLAGAAFAGQHDTFLNCRGVDAILERIRDAFVSLWSERAVLYRHQHGFEQDQAAMAVVVQRLAACDVSGVGFSLNPVTGAMDEIMLTGNHGLGESVVGGDVEVDQWHVAKADLSVRQARTGHKTAKVVATEQGVAWKDMAPTEIDRPCLSPAQVTEVARLVVAAETHFGFPQDIEWGLEGGRAWLLQSRPVTVIPPRWTRDESAERFPDVITPLAWDFVERAFHTSLGHSFDLMGLPRFPGKWFALFDNYVYGNQNAVDLYMGRPPLRLRSLDDLRTALPAIRRRYGWIQDLPAAWFRDLDSYLLGIGRLMAEPLADKTPAELWAHVREVVDLGARYFRPNIAISITQSGLHRMLFATLALAVDEGEAARLCDTLLAVSETKTAQVNHEIVDLAVLVRSTPGLAEALAAIETRRAFEDTSLAAYPEFRTRFDTFLSHHGHREIDFDPYHPTWCEAPWVVLANIRLIAAASETEFPAERERQARIAAQRAESALLARLPEDLRFFFHELIRLTRTYTGLDDIEHYQSARLTLPLRRGLRELGARLVAMGILADPWDVFFARADDLDMAAREENWQVLAASIAAAKASYLENRNRAPAWVHGRSERPADDGNGLQGVAGSPGIAEGSVYIVRGPDDFAGFPQGAVLVARTTSPAWTPLFYNACAVVTESGGPLSHGAVTAREMGLPAVMAARGVLARLRNGARIRVDGTTGRVSLL